MIIRLEKCNLIADKPKEAFVQRFEGVNRLLLVLFTAFGVFTTGLVLFFLLGPEIVMQ